MYGFQSSLAPDWRRKKRGEINIPFRIMCADWCGKYFISASLFSWNIQTLKKI